FSPHGVVCKNFPIAPVMATRGCPYMCTFCASANTKLRKRSIPLMLQEIKLLQKTHGIREFHMVDDNFTLEMDYAKQFMRALMAAVGAIAMPGFCMFAFRGETSEDIEKTIQFSKELPLRRATSQSFMPLPGTEV